MASSPKAAYLYEPLNADTGIRGLEEYFQGPVPPNGDLELEELVHRVLALRFRLKPGAYETDRGIRAFAKNVIGGRNRLSYFRCRFDPRVSNVIWKDPFAALLAPYVATVHQIPVVITVRSPYAVAASFKRLGWSFNLDPIESRLQHARPTSHTTPHHSSTDCDPTLNAARLWSLLYGYLAARTKDNPNVQWVDVARLIENPFDSYRTIFSAAGLDFTPRVERTIEQLYKDSGRSEPTVGRAHDRRRNVQQSTDYWQRLLTTDEVSRISDIVRDTVTTVEERLQ